MIAPTVLAAARWPARPAIVLADSDAWLLSFADLEKAVLDKALDLVGRGVGPGSIVGLMGDNSAGWIVAHLALGRLGAACLPLNFRLADPEISWQLASARALAVLTDAPNRDLGAVPIWPLGGPGEANATPGRRPSRKGSFHSGGASWSSPMRKRWSEIGPGRAHTVLFTSGTTGRPKGVVLTWNQHLASARAMAEALDLGPNDRWLLCMPLFHVGGMAIVHRMMAVGGCTLVLPRFEVTSVHEAIERYHPTRISLTATTARRLLDAHPEALASIKTVLLGGEAIGADLLSRCPHARPSYGLTEAGSTVAMAAPGESGLWPLPGFDVRVTDLEGNPCSPQEIGRIGIRGPALMSGYLRVRPLAGGWFETGDLGMRSAKGELTVMARREDLILSGGENVYPAEVESMLIDHPDVLAAAVTGILDDRWGQIPVAAIVCRDRQPDPGALAAFIRERLASYKVPKRFAFVSALPSRPSGKLDRLAVAALFDR